MTNRIKTKIPKQCKSCFYLWTGNSKRPPHCCQYGKSAIKCLGHCKQMGGYKEKDK